VNTRTLKENAARDPTTNADNYRWYAQELFWSVVCDFQFGDATNNVDYVACTDSGGYTIACRMPGPDKPQSNPLLPPTPPASTPPQTKALSINLQNYIDQIGNVNKWFFYATDRGVSALCGKEKDAVASFLAQDGATLIDNPPWPGGTFKVKVDGMDCEYKNDGTNAGALWCSGRGAISCQEEHAKGKGEKGSKVCENNGDSSRSQHPVVFCEW